jgi:tRNA1Val (adenine37-N6)-methyltransferase
MEKDSLVKPNERLDDLQIKNLFIIQNPKKYCFTSDAVHLANFCKAKHSDVVVDLCSGSGVIGTLVWAKTNAKKVYLVELQQYLADLSLRSVKYNNLSDVIEVLNEPLQNIHKKLSVGFADVVVCNPPYKMQNSSLLNEDLEIAKCKHEITVTLKEIVCEASKLLKFGGDFYTINKEERLIDLICYLKQFDLEPKIIEIIPSAKGSSLVMVKAKKGGKSGVRINVHKV